MKAIEKTRIDLRLSKEQNFFLKYTAAISGYRSLAEFILVSVEERARKIVEEQGRILGSKRDQEIFFQAISNPAKPNKSLQNAAHRYNDLAKSL